ncbi:hypothetical protein VN97_g1221 [Penicillium thymicola]|uniref:C2H2-type domain-containing protein n=1 Tax=Penicillium thymicola TaxID=293382 RepID=A0AAI9XCL2_PENTH|nr:hypothetical protein VN97_g1221 [Penicillium thymicola]
MARPLRNDHMDHQSISWQSEPGNGDSTFYKDMTAIQAPRVTAAKQSSTEYSFYGPDVQHASSLLDPNFTLPSNLGLLDLDYIDQGTMQGFFPRWNSTTEGMATDYHRLAESIVQVSSLDSPSSAKQPSSPKGNDIPTTQGNRTRGRRANKQEDYHGSFECHWIDCTHRHAFSCESVLIRHIRTQHINPSSINCPRCDKSFNRKNNMKEHVGRIHREYI